MDAEDDKFEEEVKEKPSKWKRRKNQKLTKKEMLSIKNTHTKIFNWLKPADQDEVTPSVECRDITEESMEVVDRDREDRLARLSTRQKKWMTNRTCRSLVTEIMDMAIQESDHRICKEILIDQVVSKALIEIEVQQIMEMMDKSEDAVRSTVEGKLRDELLEAEGVAPEAGPEKQNESEQEERYPEVMEEEDIRDRDEKDDGGHGET